MPVRLEPSRQRGGLTHQSDGYAAIGRDVRVVGEKRLAIGLSGHHEQMRGRQSLLLKDLPYRIGSVRRQFPSPISRPRRYTARGRVARNGDPVRQRLQGPGELLNDTPGPLVGLLGPVREHGTAVLVDRSEEHTSELQSL